MSTTENIVPISAQMTGAVKDQLTDLGCQHALPMWLDTEGTIAVVMCQARSMRGLRCIGHTQDGISPKWTVGVAPECPEGIPRSQIAQIIHSS